MKAEGVSKVRCFICLEPDAGVLNRLQAWLAPLRSLAPRLKWVRPEALHLTVKFCGELPAETVDRLCGLLRTELTECAPFSLGLEGTGVFPLHGVPRVLWGGVTGDVGALSVLFDRVERSAFACGIPREKRSFSPHLTLARIRAATDIPGSWLRSGPPGPATWGTWTVREATFMQSRLRPEGPSYSPIEQFPLLTIQGGGR